MNLKNWTIWYCYSTYFNRNIADLNSAAKDLIDLGLAEFVMLSDQRCFWKGEDQAFAGQLKISQHPHKARAEIEFPEGMNGFPLECAYQAAWMAVGERDIFHNPKNIISNYLRAFPGKFQICFDGERINLYPILKIYENGVLLIELRLFSGPDNIDVSLLVENYVNLFNKIYDSIYVPPKYTLWMSSILRDEIQSGADSFVEWATTDLIVDEGEEFTFPVKEITQEDLKEKLEYRLDVELLFELIEIGLENVLFGKPQKKLLKFRQKKEEVYSGKFWSIRPAIYLIDYDESVENSDELKEKFSDSIAKILYRVTSVETNADLNLEEIKDLRPFNDYSVFINKGVSIWAFTNLAKKLSVEYEDPNYGYLIYDKQAQVENIEYIYMLHKMLLDNTMNPHRRIEDIVETETKIMNLRWSISEISKYGEIVDLFRHVGTYLEWDAIRSQANQNIILTTRQIEEKRIKNTNKFGWILTILFGITGIPSLARNVIEPFMNICGLWLPRGYDARVLYLFLLASLLLILPISCFLKVIKAKN